MGMRVMLCTYKRKTYADLNAVAMCVAAGTCVHVCAGVSKHVCVHLCVSAGSVTEPEV